MKTNVSEEVNFIVRLGLLERGLIKTIKKAANIMNLECSVDDDGGSLIRQYKIKLSGNGSETLLNILKKELLLE